MNKSVEWEAMWRLRALDTAGGSVKWARRCGNGLVVLRKVNTVLLRFPMWPCNQAGKHTQVHCSVITNRQGVEIARVPTNRQ